MRRIALLIQEGAAAFLRREYTFLAAFVALVAVLIAVFVDFDVTGKFAALGMVQQGHLTGLPRTAIAYVLGAIASALAGYVGMYIAVRANVRTAAKARQGVFIAQAAGQARGDFPQQGIAHRVAETVVDRLEVVQVDE